MTTSPRYQRILLKLSGESLRGAKAGGYDRSFLLPLAHEIGEMARQGVQISIVVGGGNFFRGAKGEQDWLERTQADAIGMLATMMNGIALRSLFVSQDIPCSLYSALPLPGLVPGLDSQTLREDLRLARVVVFAAGTGHPFVSTDTAAALRARQVNAQILIKATQVEGVYDDDPRKNPNARLFSHLSYLDVLQKELKVMDATSVSFCRDYQIPILVCDIQRPGQLTAALSGRSVGTWIGPLPSHDAPSEAIP